MRGWWKGTRARSSSENKEHRGQGEGEKLSEEGKDGKMRSHERQRDFSVG